MIIRFPDYKNDDVYIDLNKIIAVRPYETDRTVIDTGFREYAVDMPVSKVLQIWSPESSKPLFIDTQSAKTVTVDWMRRKVRVNYKSSTLFFGDCSLCGKSYSGPNSDCCHLCTIKFNAIKAK